MKTHATATSFWSTASFGESVDTSALELSTLGEHLDRCNLARGRWFALRRVAETMNGFVAPRFVTTLVVIALLFGVASLVL